MIPRARFLIRVSENKGGENKRENKGDRPRDKPHFSAAFVELLAGHDRPCEAFAVRNDGDQDERVPPPGNTSTLAPAHAALSF